MCRRFEPRERERVEKRAKSNSKCFIDHHHHRRRRRRLMHKQINKKPIQFFFHSFILSYHCYRIPIAFLLPVWGNKVLRRAVCVNRIIGSNWFRCGWLNWCYDSGFVINQTSYALYIHMCVCGSSSRLLHALTGSIPIFIHNFSAAVINTAIIDTVVRPAAFTSGQPIWFRSFFPRESVGHQLAMISGSQFSKHAISKSMLLHTDTIFLRC